MRANGVVLVVYGFGDTSGLGFGTAIELDGKLTPIQKGTCPWAVGQEMSPNWRDCLTWYQLSELSDKEHLEGKEVFLFTDNTVSERAYFKGTSKSKTLFELILVLRKLKLTGKLKLYSIMLLAPR